MADDKLQQLKEKYVSVLSVLNREDLRVRNIHLQDNKLFIRAEAPNDQAKNKFWDAVRKVDADYNKDFAAEISVVAAAAPPSRPQERAEKLPPGVTPVSGEKREEPKEQTYTVVKGDTLSAISKKFYGDPNQYMKIFNANKDQLKDPDKIQPGQVLKIPAKDSAA